MPTAAQGGTKDVTVHVVVENSTSTPVTATATPGAPTAGKWRGGYIRGFDSGGYGIITEAHEAIQDAGFNPTAEGEEEALLVNWRGGYIPGFADGGSPNDERLQQANYNLAHAKAELARDPHNRNLQQSVAQSEEQIAMARGLVTKDKKRQEQSNEGNRRAAARKKAQQEQKEKEEKEEQQRKQESAQQDALSRQLGGFAGGGIPGFAMGTVHGPGTGTSDSILARLSAGEFVMKNAAVRAYGTGFMHAVNDMRIPPPHYAQGGMVPLSALPRFAEGGGVGKADSILNLHVGGESFMGLKAPEAVATQLRKFAIGQQTTSTGKKPSWTT